MTTMAISTIHYHCGCSATGPAPLPRLCGEHRATSCDIDPVGAYLQAIRDVMRMQAELDHKSSLVELIATEIDDHIQSKVPPTFTSMQKWVNFLRCPRVNGAAELKRSTPHEV